MANKKFSVRIEIGRDEISNDCPLRNGSSFEYFSYTKPVQKTKKGHNGSELAICIMIESILDNI